ncbi:Rv1733c family protein [Streptomyces sp. NPDC004393]|uniref:Rv1733c family protein n=1 Tax=Streptomyces sp. NPDC004533 TaxID=3154278 RepID=UPI00339EDA2B
MAATGRIRGTRWPGAWRWRRNPLRRRSDRLEAWLVLGIWAFVLLAGVLGGRAVAGVVDQALAAHRARSHAARAVLTQDAGRTSAALPGYGEGGMWAQVSWTASGSPHTGLARVQPGTKSGTAVTVWTDRSGALVSRPATADQARTQAQVVGTLAGMAAAAGVLVCGRLLRGRLDRRRMEAWDREWEWVGPQWRRTAG